MGNYKKWPNDVKETIVKEYLSGGRISDVVIKYDVNPTQIKRWTKKWREFGCFPDKRGKRGKGKIIKPKTHKRTEMTDNEYIEYLEMQLEIKKFLALYEKRKQK